MMWRWRCCIGDLLLVLAKRMYPKGAYRLAVREELRVAP